MGRLKTFKLIVQPTDNCLELLRYIHKNIEDINAMDARIVIEKLGKDDIDDEMVEIFRKKGITRLPALIAPDGHTFIGIKQVISLFEKNLKAVRTNSRADPAQETNAEMGSNPDLASFWEAEMYQGYDQRTGKFVPRDDGDEEDDECKDMKRKLAAASRKTQPKHRVAGVEHEIDDAPRQRRGRGRTEEIDNIADDDLPEAVRQGAAKGPAQRPRGVKLSSGDKGADDMDQRMLDAYLDNTPED